MADFTDKVAKARAAGYSDDEIVQFLSSGDMSSKIKQAKDAGYSSAEIVNHLGGSQQMAKGPADASTAINDPEWAKKGRTLYKESNGSDFKGSDADAAKWLNNYLYDFNYRLAGVGTDNARGTLDTAAQISGYSDAGKKAFVDAQTQFENMNTTLGGVGEATKRVLTDPTTDIGLGTFGLGTAGAQATKAAAKKGVTELAKIGAKQAAKRGAAVGAAEGAVYGTVSDLGQQQAMVNAGGQEAIDPMQTAQTAGIGAVTGGVLGGAGGAIAGGIAGRNPAVRAARQLEQDPQKALRGAEITQNIADAQATRDVPMGLSDVNQQADVLRSDILKSLKELSLPNDKLQLYRERLTKARGLTAKQVDELRATPEGNVVADNIQVLKQMRDMVAPQASEGGIKRALRTGIDYMPVPRVVGDALKYAFLKPRRTGEEMISRTVSPKNLKIAQEITRLGGQSEAAIGRQNLASSVDIVRKAKEAIRTTVSSQRKLEDIVPGFTDLPAHLQQGLRVAAQAKVQKEIDTALAAAEKMKIAEIKARNKNIAEAKQSMRFQEYQLKQKERSEKGAQSEAEKVKRDNIAGAKREQNFQWNMMAQRQREEQRAAKAIADAEAAAAQAQTKQEREFNQALAATNRIIRFREAMRKLKEKEAVSEVARSIGLPPHGQSIGLAPKAPRQAKAKVEASLKNETKKAEASANAHSKAAQSNEGYPSPARNEIAYQGGKDLIVGYQEQAKEFANSTPDKKLGDLIRKSVEKFERTRGRSRQAERMTIYREALEEAEKMGEEAFYYVDRYLEPLALVFEQPKGSK